MATCRNCKQDKGCSCNLDKNGLCSKCRREKENSESKVKIKIPNELTNPQPNYN